MLGYHDGALADADLAIKDAGEISQAGTLMFALNCTSVTNIQCGNYAVAKAQSAKVIALADEKSASFWNAFGLLKPRLRAGPDRQSRGRGSHDHLRDCCMAVNGSNNVSAMVANTFGESIRGPWPI